MNRKPNISDDPAELRRRAETRLRDQRKGRRSKAGDQKSEADTMRMLHELEVHQIELEMQNAELQKVRDDMEAALERYTDLYDFAPVGYFSIDESGMILEVNLTGAALLGVERSRLINRRLLLFVSATSRPIFLAFLKKVFTGPTDQVCEALLLKEGGGTFWASFRATSAVCPKGARKWCRVAFGDITVRKQAEEAQRRLEAMADTNRGLNREIARRQTVEKALQKSEQHQNRLLEQSRHMQEQLRHLSHQILHAQEEERKRISRELHDEIAQTLVGINVHLAALTREAADNPRGLQQKIARTQRLVEKSVDIVHLFARELRPAALDDLGVIPALHAFMKEFTKRTGIHIHFTTFTSKRIKQLNNATRTVFYRVAQEALTNVARHAQASRVEVNFEKLPNAICLKIKDNGKSFQAQRVMQSKRNTRLGLIGMRERLEMVGGSFSVESAPGKGTTVRAQIPLANRRAGRGAENPLMEPTKTKP
jgi:PAS domain S-box-containing protein